MIKDRKIMIVIGTKAELIKCMPIMRLLEERNQKYWFVSTGQHPLKKSAIKFGIKQPDFILSKESEISTKFWSRINKYSIGWCFLVLYKTRKLIKKLKPKYVIYHGDTMSSAVASVASSRLINPFKNWNNVHLEAGLRSGNIMQPFPEEISRQICDRFSDILLAVSEYSKNNLKKSRWKGIFGNIYNTGNTIIDSANIIYNESKEINQDKILPKEFALINIHRHENIKSEITMRKIVDIIKSISIEAILPLHDNTRYYLEKYNMMKELNGIRNLKIIELIDYHEFIYLISKCKYVITDGGSIQEESLIFKKPCIILRNVTERQEGIESGINFLTKLNVEYTINLIKRIEDNKIIIKKFSNPYGKVGVSEKILEILA